MYDDLINGSTATKHTIDRDLQDTRSSPMILVHLSQDEAEYLDIMQGGMETMELIPGDPSTAVRSYARLDNLWEIPEIRAVLEEIFNKFMHADTMHNLESDINNSTPPPSPYEYTEGDFSPEGVDLEASGTLKYSDDTIIAYMPINFANFLTHFKGVDERDPVYNLRQFGKKRKLFGFIPIGRDLVEPIRIAATVVGAIYGGPAGAGIGAAAGNYATGAGAEKSIKRGLGVYGVTSLAGSGLQATAPEFMASNPSFASALGQGPGGAFGGWGESGGFLSKFGADKVGTVGGANKIGNTDKLLNIGEKSKNLPLEKGVSPDGGIFGFMKDNPLLTMGGLGALAYFGKKDEEERQKEEDERLDDTHQALLEENRDRIGYYSQFRPGSLRPRTIQYATPNDLTDRKLFNKGGEVYLEPGEEYVTGFKYLDGHTKGQDDEVDINLPKGAWVVDASTNSMLGDGNSRAGKTVIEKFSDYLESKAKHIPHLNVPTGRVPCALSDGEPTIPPESISMLGYISNPNKKDHNLEGAKVMKQITNNIRKHKTMNKGGLPPKAKDILDYAPLNVRKKLNAN